MGDNRVNPADENNSAIQWASFNGHFNVVKLFLFTTVEDKRVINFYKISDYNNIAIRRASLNGHYKVVKLFLRDNRVNTADVKNCAIRLASKNEYYNVIKLFLFTTVIDKRVKNSFNIDNINYIKKNCSCLQR